MNSMTPAEALYALSQHTELPFYADVLLTPVYRQLVMQGLARCRVDAMRDEWVRITPAGTQALTAHGPYAAPMDNRERV